MDLLRTWMDEHKAACDVKAERKLSEHAQKVLWDAQKDHRPAW